MTSFFYASKNTFKKSKPKLAYRFQNAPNLLWGLIAHNKKQMQIFVAYLSAVAALN